MSCPVLTNCTFEITTSLMKFFITVINGVEIPRYIIHQTKVLLAQLFENYDRNARPVVKADDSVTLATVFVLGRIEELVKYYN